MEKDDFYYFFHLWGAGFIYLTFHNSPVEIYYHALKTHNPTAPIILTNNRGKNMETTIYNGKECVVLPIEVWENLKQKILAQRQLIDEFEKEMKA